MADNPMSVEQMQFVLHVARRLQLLTMIAMACDVAFGVGYAFASDLTPWEATLFSVILGVALACWVAAVLAEAAAMRHLRRMK